MASVKQHYDTQLAGVYAWMSGDFSSLQREFEELLQRFSIFAGQDAVAWDLGAGHGIQTAALAHKGFQVVAVDFSEALLDELKEHTRDLPVEIAFGDIRVLELAGPRAPQLVLCWGDTLLHLDDEEDIRSFLKAIHMRLQAGGELLISIRDYSKELSGVHRFIPVRSDEHRIMTCFLEYGENRVYVTDIVQERQAEGWSMQVSSYEKVRLTPAVLTHMALSIGFEPIHNEMWKGWFVLHLRKHGLSETML